MAAKKQTYEQAMKRLEEIVSRIDSNELDIDSLGVNLKEAQELIKFRQDILPFRCMVYLRIIRFRCRQFRGNTFPDRLLEFL